MALAQLPSLFRLGVDENGETIFGGAAVFVKLVAGLFGENYGAVVVAAVLLGLAMSAVGKALGYADAVDKDERQSLRKEGDRLLGDLHREKKRQRKREADDAFYDQYGKDLMKAHEYIDKWDD